MSKIKIYSVALLALMLVYIFIPFQYANYTAIAVMAIFWFLMKKENQEEQARWNIINKFDWRLFLPIGIVILIYFVYQIQTQRLIEPNMLVRFGMLCFVLGVVNLAGKFMFRKPVENLKSMTITGEYNPIFFKRNIIAVFVLIAVLVLGFWIISLFS